jgi:hypothetical protein
MDVGGQVAFFTPRGRVLFDVPKTRFLAEVEERHESEEPEMEPVPESRTEWESGSDRRGHWRPQPIPRYASRPPHLSGAAKWTRDRDIPYDAEARAWEALDSE